MMMSLLERLNHAFSGGIMFVQPTAETILIKQLHVVQKYLSKKNNQIYNINRVVQHVGYLLRRRVSITWEDEKESYQLTQH